MWYILEFLNLLGSPHKLESRLAGGVSLLDAIELDLQLLQFNAGVSKFAVKVVVSVDLASESPVIMIKEGVMEQGEVN